LREAQKANPRIERGINLLDLYKPYLTYSKRVKRAHYAVEIDN